MISILRERPFFHVETSPCCTIYSYLAMMCPAVGIPQGKRLQAILFSYFRRGWVQIPCKQPQCVSLCRRWVFGAPARYPITCSGCGEDAGWGGRPGCGTLTHLCRCWQQLGTDAHCPPSPHPRKITVNHLPSLKTKMLLFWCVFATVCTGRFRNNDFLWNQWRKYRKKSIEFCGAASKKRRYFSFHVYLPMIVLFHYRLWFNYSKHIEYGTELMNMCMPRNTLHPFSICLRSYHLQVYGISENARSLCLLINLWHFELTRW